MEESWQVNRVYLNLSGKLSNCLTSFPCSSAFEPFDVDLNIAKLVDREVQPKFWNVVQGNLAKLRSLEASKPPGPPQERPEQAEELLGALIRESGEGIELCGQGGMCAPGILFDGLAKHFEFGSALPASKGCAMLVWGAILPIMFHLPRVVTSIHPSLLLSDKALDACYAVCALKRASEAKVYPRPGSEWVETLGIQTNALSEPGSMAFFSGSEVEWSPPFSFDGGKRLVLFGVDGRYLVSVILDPDLCHRSEHVFSGIIPAEFTGSRWSIGAGSMGKGGELWISLFPRKSNRMWVAVSSGFPPKTPGAEFRVTVSDAKGETLPENAVWAALSTGVSGMIDYITQEKLVCRVKSSNPVLRDDGCTDEHRLRRTQRYKLKIDDLDPQIRLSRVIGFSCIGGGDTVVYKIVDANEREVLSVVVDCSPEPHCNLSTRINLSREIDRISSKCTPGLDPAILNQLLTNYDSSFNFAVKAVPLGRGEEEEEEEKEDEREWLISSKGIIMRIDAGEKEREPL